MSRLLCALAAVVVAIAAPPLAGLVVAALALAAIFVERAGARAWHAWRAPALTVAIAIALQAWLGGRHAALVLGARVAGASAATAWLLSTTRSSALIAALRAVRAPAAIIDLLTLALRYLVVLRETTQTAREAQRVRLGWQSLGGRVRSFGTLGGVVVGRAVDQSVAIGEAMRARGKA